MGMETTDLLSDEEKERFYKELKTLGFEVVKQKEVIKKVVPKIYTQNWPLVSSDNNFVIFPDHYNDQLGQDDD